MQELQQHLPLGLFRHPSSSTLNSLWEAAVKLIRAENNGKVCFWPESSCHLSTQEAVCGAKDPQTRHGKKLQNMSQMHLLSVKCGLHRKDGNVCTCFFFKNWEHLKSFTYFEPTVFILKIRFPSETSHCVSHDGHIHVLWKASRIQQRLSIFYQL